MSGLEGPDAALCRRSRANALVALAELGEEPRAESPARRLTLPGGSERPGGAGRGWMPNESRWGPPALAGLGEEPRANLRRADALLQRAQSGLEGPDAARCRMRRANSLTDLARQGEEPLVNLRLADALYQEAVSDLQGPSAALCRMNRATTLQELALLGEEPRANLRRADALYQAAQSGLDKPNAAVCRMNRANALRALAEMGDDVEMNYDQAASLHERAGQIFDALDSWINASKAYKNLGWLEQTRDRWGPARDAYVRGIDASERVRSATLAVSDRRQWSESQHRLYQRAVEASLRIGDDAMACASAERGRSRALLDLLHTEDVVPRIERVKAERYRRLRRRLEELETLLAVKAAF